MNTRSTRLTLLGLAAGILLALLLVPQTRWLVRAQLLPSTQSPDHVDRQRRQFVQQHPSDYQIQLAGQTDSASDNQLAYERSLVPRFPESASLRANILRYATMKEVHLNRDESSLLEGQPVPPPHVDPQNLPSTPAQLAAFDADAAAGERLDPDNGYFPFMRAVSLFAARRDAEGLAAIQRASTKHVWREYFNDEVEGRWRVNDAIYGGREAIGAMAVSAAVLYPHYQALRAVARLVCYKAVLDEQAGHPEAGLAKRQAIGRCGELMGVQAQSIIGNLVGVAINSISRSRPGGVPPLTYDSILSDDQRAQVRLTAYCAYVTKISHPEAAAEAQADYHTWQQINHLMSKISDYPSGWQMADMFRLTITLVSGWVLIANILIVFFLGFVAAGLNRVPRIKVGQPLPAGVTLGFWSVLLLGLLMVALFVDAGSEDFPLFALSLVLILLILTIFTAVRVPGVRRPLSVGLLTGSLTLAVLGLLTVFASWQIRGGYETIASVQQMFSPSGSDSANGMPLWYNSAQGPALLGVAFALATPLLSAIILSVVSRVKRVPVSVGLVGGFRAIMPPLVFGLMLVYGGLTLWTVRQEARVSYGLERSMHGEGQYLAQITGATWPSR